MRKIGYEIRDMAVGAGIPIVAAAGMIAVNHHFIHFPWEHEGQRPAAVAAPAPVHTGAEGAVFGLTPAQESFLQQHSPHDSHEAVDRAAAVLAFAGIGIGWAAAGLLPRRRESQVTPTSIPAQRSAAESIQISQ